MRAWIRTVTLAAGIAVLLAACGGPTADAASGRSTAARAQASIKTMYDALVAAIGGEPTSGTGDFVNCNLGNNSLKWSFRGYVRGATGSDLVARAGAALVGAGFTHIPADGVHHTLDQFRRQGLSVFFQTKTVSAGWLEIQAESPCRSYDTSSADELKRMGVWSYGKPLPGSAG